MSTALKLTLAEFDQMIDRGAFDDLHRRIELIYGELREMNPAGPIHDDISSYLGRWSVENTSANEVSVRVQCSLELPDLGSVVEPDVAWVKSNRYRDRRPRPADVLLLIEVARSSLPKDLAEKGELYATAGIQEYWVVDVDANSVRAFREPSPQGYRYQKIIKVGEQLCPLAFPRIQLDVATLFQG